MEAKYCMYCGKKLGEGDYSFGVCSKCEDKSINNLII